MGYYSRKQRRKQEEEKSRLRWVFSLPSILRCKGAGHHSGDIANHTLTDTEGTEKP